MSIRDEFVAAARGHFGVRHRHQGRTAWAVDCLGLVVRSCAAVGRALPDRKGYGRDPQADGLQRVMRAEFGPPATGYVHGGVAAMRWKGATECSHVGIVFMLGGEWWLIHSYSSVGRVVEHRIDDAWAALIEEVYDPWPA